MNVTVADPAGRSYTSRV